MNILPHKSWHVRTKKNIERVRKDEAEAAEKEKEVQRRVHLAAQESRTSFLRERAGQRVKDTGEDLPIPLGEVADLTQSDGHINFFQEIEDGKKQDTGVNAEHEAEKKKEAEDYEKKIGVLVYLGQNSIEESKNRPWYESIDRLATPSSATSLAAAEKAALEAKEVKQNKLRDFEDPLKEIRKYMSTPGLQRKFGLVKATAPVESVPNLKRKCNSEPSSSETKHKKSKKEKKKKKSKKHKSKKSKHRHHSSESESSGPDSEEEKKRINLEKLRTERLAREREERRKAEKLLANLRGETIPDKPDPRPSDEVQDHGSSNHSRDSREPRVKQKYNSQFNPQLARQNYENN